MTETATGGVAWQTLLDEAADRLAGVGIDNAEQEARWLVQRASGLEGAELIVGLEEPASLGDAAFFYDMVERRLRGEPLQYVLGRWGFRVLDLRVDNRVLIPRPETEALTQMALEECRRLEARLAVDLGTGSGAIALALAVEWAGIEVWATDISPDALAVAEENVASLGGIGEAVRLAQGSWYDALPAELAGAVEVIVSNPPYVAEFEVEDLPEEVRAWEPLPALVSGPTGLEAIERIVADAPLWLAHPGSLLVEIAPHQAADAVAMARATGFGSAAIWPDLTGRDRILLARA
ncbi:MAG TPA: peptide chain release factor N(5)-glutamine methyltransferase [Acidimicrobiales bacterium]|nr:peptide chain release factor N(5)-glutamine methyltransferase [Acidimicrobiales bacterium]